MFELIFFLLSIQQQVWDLEGSLDFWKIVIVVLYGLVFAAFCLGVYVLSRLKELEKDE